MLQQGYFFPPRYSDFKHLPAHHYIRLINLSYEILIETKKKKNKSVGLNIYAFTCLIQMAKENINSELYTPDSHSEKNINYIDINCGSYML